MNNLLEIIEKDNLTDFIKVFDISKWKESITQIENYAGISEYTPTITYNDCDAFKYALHNNADKIFNYLLPLVHIEKHGENYGWPLLSMALKNNRYDYAHAILEHPSFDPYPMYHTNHFRFIEKKDNPEEHIKFLFHYLTKFDKFDFRNPNLVNIFTHLICYNENTFQQFNSFYQNTLKNPNAFVLDLFNDDLNVLAQEVFYNYFRPFILDKLSDDKLRSLIASTVNDSITYCRIFENKSNQAQQGLNYLIKHPDLLQEHTYKNPVVVSYLPLSCLIFLEDNNIDIWTNKYDKGAVIDYIINNDKLENEKTLYFMNKYPQKIYDYFQGSNKKSNIVKYCHKLLLSDILEEKNITTKKKKI